MTQRLQHLFALSGQGAKDLVKAVVWCFLCNISLMLPVGVTMAAVQYLLQFPEGDALSRIFTDIIIEQDNASRIVCMLFQPFTMHVGGMILQWIVLESACIKRTYSICGRKMVYDPLHVFHG